MSFSWSGIKLVVDLKIDTATGATGEIVGEIVRKPSGVGYVIPQNEAREDGTTNELSSTQESSNLQCEIDPVKGPLAYHVNDEKDCEKQQPIKVDGKCGSEPTDYNCTPCGWPEWGDPLPPEDLDDDLDLNSGFEVEKSHTSKKMVTFSDVVTFVEPSSLQEERETGSFSYVGSSDDELEQGTDQVTSSSDGNSCDFSLTPLSSLSEKESLDSPDVSAACHLLELGNESNCRYLNENGLDSPRLNGRRKCEFYDPSNDLERLSEVVEKIYAALPQLSSVSDSQASVSNQEVGYWTIEVLKDSGRFRMKRIKREKEGHNCPVGAHYSDDDSDVLERPPWKRQYKLLRNF